MRTWIDRVRALKAAEWWVGFDRARVAWLVSLDERRSLVRVLVWLEADDPDSELVAAIRQHLPVGAVVPEPTPSELAIASMVMRRLVDDPQLRAGVALMGDLGIIDGWLGTIEEELEAAA